jgi:AcrR family transcriptional regulator
MLSDSTRDRILETTEKLLRRYGPEKLAVVDVARALGMSHGNVYRHFESKSALLDAIAQTWLKTVSDPLQQITASTEDPARKLELWLRKLSALKRAKVTQDPELFRMYHSIAEKTHAVVTEHVRDLTRQLDQILSEGVAAGVFRDASGAAILWATARFHHPAMLSLNGALPTDEEFDAVLNLVLSGLRP